MTIVNRREFVAAVAGAVVAPSAVQRGPARFPWQAGTATVDITPDRSLWMAGFALRKQASQGVALPLHAKALALKTSNGAAAVLVTVDLLGVTRRITDRVATEVQRRHGISRAEPALQCQPYALRSRRRRAAVGSDDLSSDQWDAIRAYTVGLEDKLIALVGDAVSRLRPARVDYARGEAAFAANRRVKFSPDGPVDHSVPVLRVVGPDTAWWQLFSDTRVTTPRFRTDSSSITAITPGSPRRHSRPGIQA